jgi:hypothetical protein
MGITSLTLSFYTFIHSVYYLRQYGRARTADNVKPVTMSITEPPAPRSHYRGIHDVSINTLRTISYPKLSVPHGWRINITYQPVPTVVRSENV